MAISAVTSPERRRLWDRPAEADRLSSLRLELTSAFEALSAGKRLASTAEARETAKVKRRTLRSRLNETALIASLKARFARRNWIPQYANSNPALPPPRAISRPSQSSWRIIRNR